MGTKGWHYWRKNLALGLSVRVGAAFDKVRTLTACQHGWSIGLRPSFISPSAGLHAGISHHLSGTAFQKVSTPNWLVEDAVTQLKFARKLCHISTLRGILFASVVSSISIDFFYVFMSTGSKSVLNSVATMKEMPASSFLCDNLPQYCSALNLVINQILRSINKLLLYKME